MKVLIFLMISSICTLSGFASTKKHIENSKNMFHLLSGYGEYKVEMELDRLFRGRKFDTLKEAQDYTEELFSISSRLNVYISMTPKGSAEFADSMQVRQTPKKSYLEKFEQSFVTRLSHESQLKLRQASQSGIYLRQLVEIKGDDYYEKDYEYILVENQEPLELDLESFLQETSVYFVVSLDRDLSDNLTNRLYKHYIANQWDDLKILFSHRNTTIERIINKNSSENSLPSGVTGLDSAELIDEIKKSPYLRTLMYYAKKTGRKSELQPQIYLSGYGFTIEFTKISDKWELTNFSDINKIIEDEIEIGKTKINDVKKLIVNKKIRIHHANISIKTARGSKEKLWNAIRELVVSDIKSDLSGILK